MVEQLIFEHTQEIYRQRIELLISPTDLRDLHC